MSELLAKLFTRGNRLSDRFYSDRARPDRDAKQVARERRDRTRSAEVTNAVHEEPGSRKD